MQLKILQDEDSEEYKMPHRSKKGWIEFEIYHVYVNPISYVKYELDVIDADLDSAVAWINEGVGIDYFINEYIDLALPGKYRVEGVTCEYYRGYRSDYFFGEDDDEEYFFERVMRIE